MASEYLLSLINDVLDMRKIFILAKVLEQTEETVTCRFSVTDTGIGMSEEFQKQMFDPFTQEHGENRSEFKGTGLGLSIVK